jgi:hypothetical protein
VIARTKLLAPAIAAALAIAAAAPIASAQWTAPAPTGVAPYGTPPPGTPLPGTPPVAPQPAPYGGMSAGGLAPPPPMPGPPPAGSGKTEEQLEKAKKADSGRGLEWVWVDVGGGYQHIGLQTFNPSETAFTAGFVSTTANAGLISGGVGLRLLFFTLGARGRIGFAGPFELFSLGPEVGAHFPVGNIEPHVELGGGWTGLGAFKGPVGDAGAVSMHGFYVRLGGGADYYLTPVFSVGLAASFELLGLTRPGASPDQIAALKASSGLSDADRARAVELGQKGSSFGGALGLTGQLGLHF